LIISNLRWESSEIPLPSFSIIFRHQGRMGP
jgi:hypothetical protein